MRVLKWALLLMVLLMYQGSFAGAATLEVASNVMKVKAVRINNTLTKNNNTELYMDLQNTGAMNHALIAAYSPFAKQIQIHQGLEHDKPMVLNKINAVAVPSHNDKDFHFGGLHLMLIGLEKSITNNESVPIILIFDDGSWLSTEAEVFTAPATT
jgi:copper(I)-binding protein